MSKVCVFMTGAYFSREGTPPVLGIVQMHVHLKGMSRILDPLE